MLKHELYNHVNTLYLDSKSKMLPETKFCQTFFISFQFPDLDKFLRLLLDVTGPKT